MRVSDIGLLCPLHDACKVSPIVPRLVEFSRKFSQSNQLIELSQSKNNLQITDIISPPNECTFMGHSTLLSALFSGQYRPVVYLLYRHGQRSERSGKWSQRRTDGQTDQTATRDAKSTNFAFAVSFSQFKSHEHVLTERERCHSSIRA